MTKTNKVVKRSSKGNQIRSKLKKEREARNLVKLKKNQTKKVNDEFFTLIKRENLDNLTKDNKLEILKKLYKLITSYTQQNSDKIELLFSFCEDKSLQVVIKGLKYLRKLFLDILPNYNIRDIADKDKKKNYSKEVEGLHKYETVLLKHYQKFLNILSIFSKYKKKNNQKKIILQKVSIKIIADLFEKYYLFNFNSTLYSILITKLVNHNIDIREICFKSIREVLSKNDNSKNCLELKFNLVKLICHMLFKKTHNTFSPEAIDLLIAHKIDFPEITHHRQKKNALDKKLGEDVAN